MHKKHQHRSNTFPFPEMTEEEKEYYKTYLPDEEYIKARDEMWYNGLTRTAQLKKHEPIDGWTLWSIDISGKSPLKKPDPKRDDNLHVSLAFEREMDEETKRELEEQWDRPRKVDLKFWRFGKGGAGELRVADCDVGSSEIVQRAHSMGHFRNRDLHISF